MDQQVRIHHVSGKQPSFDVDSICNFTKEERKRMRRADFAYFAAVAFPDANAERFRPEVD